MVVVRVTLLPPVYKRDLFIAGDEGCMVAVT